MIFNVFRKDNSRILTSQQLAEFLAAGTLTASGLHVTTTKALTFATVFACARVLAESVGQLPVHVFRREGRARVQVTDHALDRLFRTEGPNRYQTAQEFWEWVVTCLALRGNAYAFPTVVRGEVRELLPISPAAVTPKILDDGVTVVYDVSLKTGVKRYSAAQVFHLKLFSLDGFTGLSPIGYARETIGSALAAQEHGARLFANSARPGGVLSTDKQLGRDASKRLIKEVEEIVGGLENAGRTLVLGDGMKWQQIGLSSEDAQWLEGRKFSRSDVCGIMRVPPHMIADLERATFSNIEQQSQGFVDYSLMPYLTRIESRTRKQLLSDEERGSVFVKFNANALVRGDMTARAKYYTAQVQNGVYSPNDIRELEDMNPRDGGDVYLQPANMIANGGEDAPEEPVASPPPTDPGKPAAP